MPPFGYLSFQVYKTHIIAYLIKSEQLLFFSSRIPNWYFSVRHLLKYEFRWWNSKDIYFDTNKLTLPSEHYIINQAGKKKKMTIKILNINLHLDSNGITDNDQS